jgi:hypothetical protein
LAGVEGGWTESLSGISTLSKSYFQPSLQD